MLKSRLQIDVGSMWSCTLLFPGRIPRKAKKTARGEPMQKKFSTYDRENRVITLNKSINSNKSK